MRHRFGKLGLTYTEVSMKGDDAQCRSVTKL